MDDIGALGSGVVSAIVNGSDEKSNWMNNVSHYILSTRGPQRIPLHIVIPITIVYTVIFISGVVGNLCVCVVIIKNAAMHTSTNYFLFSLAISDLSLLLLGLPNDLGVYWQQYPWLFGVGLCKCRALVSEMASYTSVLTIVAFSMERYLAICHPLHSYSKCGLKRAVRIIGGLWFISLLAAIPFAVFTNINYLDFPPGSGNLIPESGFCAMFESNIPNHFPIYELSFVLFFLLPMIVIIALYTMIGISISGRGGFGDRADSSVHREGRHAQSRKNIVRMLSAVVITFFICWFPFHFQRLFYVYGPSSPLYNLINEWAFYVTGVLYFLSATMNPILYNLMSTKYRAAFIETLFCGKKNKTGIRSSVRDSILRTSTISSSVPVRKKAVRIEIELPEETDSGNEKVDTNGDNHHYSQVPTECIDGQENLNVITRTESDNSYGSDKSVSHSFSSSPPYRAALETSI